MSLRDFRIAVRSSPVNFGTDSLVAGEKSKITSAEFASITSGAKLSRRGALVVFGND